ncbi:SPOR domain-containing protein [Motiliproteus sp. MSK22-1]|uniref:SPOR domain-containing protein n=1 Tax=Motiliproteus sp. MSK22-1 TaxID=1897630 RepID=UPI0009767EC6|nr:SPOR domain-containing protein [Motiliproteus sp. MSK22-1]OMH38697.1 hypothetical protein BGP75_05760 [Motiliproteus sp. MSK22-1]
MSQQRKQRLVGFLLLLSLAVIFVPLVFDGEGYREGQLNGDIQVQGSIPAEPDFPVMQPYKPENKPLDDSADFADPRPQPDAPLSQSDMQHNPVASEASQASPTQETVSNRKADINTEEATKPKVEVNVAKAPISITKEKPVLDKQGVPVAWTIQLASFKDAGNAKALRKRLSDRGYKSYIRRKQDLSKVFVGPDLQRSVVEELRKKLKREFKLDGLILRFTTS